MNSSIWIEGKFIVHFKGHRLVLRFTSVPEDCLFILAISVDLDKMCVMQHLIWMFAKFFI